MASICLRNRFLCAFMFIFFEFLGLITSPAEAAIKKYQFDVSCELSNPSEEREQIVPCKTDYI
ncbi:hypothetical protein DVH24_026497 [Malus domestica]|uniref:Uncharacterized protein n=1 Tax=Malus domestica TaxID=3750 RepID=A0A498KJK4_MALDO|nr:hypothetical protein DVH24_026497 [Malus domestica]